jgi:hypothetical protein
MKNKDIKSEFRRFLTPAMILLLIASLTHSDADSREDEDRHIQIPLRLSSKSSDRGRGWEVNRFINILPNKVRADEDGLEIQV